MSAHLPGSPLEQLVGPLEMLTAFVDWEKQHGSRPGKKHVAEWALEEIDRLRGKLQLCKEIMECNDPANAAIIFGHPNAQGELPASPARGVK